MEYKKTVRYGKQWLIQVRQKVVDTVGNQDQIVFTINKVIRSA